MNDNTTPANRKTETVSDERLIYRLRDMGIQCCDLAADRITHLGAIDTDLRTQLADLLWMAEEWLGMRGDGAEPYRPVIDRARAVLSPAPASPRPDEDPATSRATKVRSSEAPRLFVDRDGDVCITGRDKNLVFCPATDDGDGMSDLVVLNPDVVTDIVSRYNEYEDLRERSEAAERRLNEMADPANAKLVSFQGGVFEFEAPVVQIFGEYLAQMLEAQEGGPANYVEMAVLHPRLGDLVLNLQRKRGKTPHHLRKEAESSLTQSRAAEADLRARNEDWMGRAQMAGRALASVLDGRSVRNADEIIMACEPKSPPASVRREMSLQKIDDFFDWVISHKASVLSGMSKRERSDFTDALGKARVAATGAAQSSEKSEDRT